MPELPDVAGFERYLASTSLHQSVRRTSVDDDRILRGLSPSQLGRRLKHVSIEATRRHGKFLFARLSGDGHLVMHFGMTGGLKYYRREDQRPRHARVVLHFERGYHLAYISQRLLGQVSHTEDPEGFIHDNDLGPDALDEGFDRPAFTQRLQGRRGPVKSRLMDQSLVAGIGNIWADEILFQCRIHPATPVEELSQGEIAGLFDCMRRVLRRGVEKGGEMDRLPPRFLLPHREGDGRCPGCGGDLERTTVGGRGTWFCPACQKEPG